MTSADNRNAPLSIWQLPTRATLTLGFIPPAALSPNARVHWAARHRATRQMRESGYEHALVELRDWLMVPCIELTYEFRHYRRLDEDSLAVRMKPFVDGLVDAEVVEDDNPSHVHYGSHRWVKAPKGESQVVVTIERIS